MDVEALLGNFDWTIECLDDSDTKRVSGRLERIAAANIQARLRGLGFDGRAIEVSVTPRIQRPWVREARRLDARARRDTTPGFERRGVKLDEEGRYSLTPEALAHWIGTLAAPRRILEIGCGVGGNTIGFARAGCMVCAIEQSSVRLEMARHNAALYEVSDKIEFVLGDARTQIEPRKADIIFIDPPWGRDYDLKSSQLSDFPLLADILEMKPKIEEYWLKLPASFATDSLPFKPQSVKAVFGRAPGDLHRVKFLLVQLESPS